MPAPTVNSAHSTLIQAFKAWGAGNPATYQRWRSEHDTAHLLELRRRLPLWKDAVAHLPLHALQALWDEPDGAWRTEVAPWPLVHEFASTKDACLDTASLWRWVGGLGVDLNACINHDLDPERPPTLSWSWPPVVRAFLQCDESACSALMAAGADLFAPVDDGRTVLHLLFETESVVPEFKKDQPSGSLWGARNTFGGNPEVAQARLNFWLPRLKAAPQELFRRDRWGRSPLSMAAATPDEEMGAHVSQFLCALLDPVPKARLSPWMQEEGRWAGDRWASWPARLLAQQGNLDLWFRLLDWGLPADLVDKNGTTTLGHLVHEAATWNTLPPAVPQAIARLAAEGGESAWGWMGASVWTGILEVLGVGRRFLPELAEALAQGDDLGRHRITDTSDAEHDLLVGVMRRLKALWPSGGAETYVGLGIQLMQLGLPLSSAAARFLARLPKADRAPFAPFQDFKLAQSLGQRLPPMSMDAPSRPRM